MLMMFCVHLSGQINQYVCASLRWVIPSQLLTVTGVFNQYSDITFLIKNYFKLIMLEYFVQNTFN